MSSELCFEQKSLSEVTLSTATEDAETSRIVEKIANRVRRGGDAVVLEYAETFSELETKDKFFYTRAELEADFESLEPADQQVLERTAKRIRAFAEIQRESISVSRLEIPGGAIGHTLAPVNAAACYAPGGRYPLPSSVLMTVIPAKTAGVEKTWVCSPRPSIVTRAAAAVAGADGLFSFGGAHAIAAFAYGTESVPAVDMIVGPGNRYVTAAKKLVSGQVGIDMLAGPSELVVLADASAKNPEAAQFIAADLLAQAEHDPDALPLLVTTSSSVAKLVKEMLQKQLRTLPTQEVASAALRNGGYLLADDLTEATALCNRLAPEHLELFVSNPNAVEQQLSNYGALFIGASSAEVFGDYGAGPNHVLPTSGGARFSSGLSVFSFLRQQTWMEIYNPKAAEELIGDTVALARLEGLEAHARAAEIRKGIN